MGYFVLRVGLLSITSCSVYFFGHHLRKPRYASKITGSSKICLVFLFEGVEQPSIFCTETESGAKMSYFYFSLDFI